ncbi:MAG: hypothetical protein FJ100_04535 [Deltaproteobacteria bacterium]|nr:hypothetical protein [Deltaproteobacteria bacterium]
MRSNPLLRIALIAAAATALGACSNASDPGASGAGAGVTQDTVTGFDGTVTGKDGTTGGTDATTGGDASGATDAAGGTDSSGSTDQDTATGTDTGGSTDQDTVTTDTGATDQDTVTADTGSTDQDTAVGGCKADKDCPASTVACKTAVCDAATGVCGTKDQADGTDCDDANGCTVGDKCGAGLCVAGSAKDCDDKNECTTDSCDPAAGCKHDNNTQQCSDGSECTTADACKDGKCEPGSAKVCDDGNPCTDDTCDAKDGCKTANNTANCDDGNACTTGEKCADGQCAGGTAVKCDDKSPCTTDSCDLKAGCKNDAAPDGTSCDDGDACSATDVCTGGKCSGTVVNCDDKNPCTKDTCDKVAGGCANTNDDAATCDDGNSCTTGDKCSAGKCGGTGKDCNDNNPCTDDSCKDNVCTNANNAAACDDGDKCTQGDTCDAGKCAKSTAVVCDDKNPCTDDACDKASGACASTNNTKACDDGSACSTGDVCKDGSCAGADKVCDDKNPCTTDSCDKATGACKAAASSDGATCDDGTVCTQNDACTAGKCTGAAVKCDDGNPCTDDSCDAKDGCKAAANTAACEDGNACTKGDKCAAGKCAPGAADLCNDNNACTKDSCDKVKGCVNANTTDKCDDKDACTDADVCAAGLCGGTAKKCDDSNPCTTDSCDKAKGCVFTNNTALCNDGSVCTGSDACLNGKCTGSAPIKCDDNNICTTDSCDPKLGCQFKAAADGGKCDDGNGCTVNDACKTGKCLGVGKSCDDNNVCTTDSCAADKCTNTNNKSPCNDGSVCTLSDACDGAGKCVGSMPLKCDDLNPCTDDKCDLAKGCTATNNTVACNDGLFCTDKDACKDGKCSNSVPKCNDGNICTTDTCDEATDKCAAANNTADCDDLDKCTPGDKCAIGKCVPGKAIDCDDGNACTLDTCDKVTGTCKYTLTTDATVCASLSVPRFWPIDNGDALWTGKSNSLSVKWLADATPAAPGKLTGLGSLNLNNGTDYADAVVGQIKATSTGKFFVDATKATGTFMTFVFHSWNGVEDSATFDNRYVEFSVDGFQTIAQTAKLDNSKAKTAWQLETVDLKALVGKKFQVRFRFDSVDGVNNAGKGWFVDDINIYLGPVVNWVAGGGYDEGFDSNVNGWQFSAAVAGSQWAIDTTPAIPMASPSTLTASTLNFNNGVDYKGTVKGWALSPVVNMEAVTTGAATLVWKEWVSVETSDSFDLRTVQVSGDAFVTLPINTTYKNPASIMGGWRWNWVDLSGLKGKKFRVAFAFDSKDDVNNTGKGWAVDELNLSTLQAPSFADMVLCANAAAWTLANGAGPGWAVDANGGVKAYSADCSLNFNNAKANAAGKFDFACAANATKATGKATSPQFTVQAPPAGQKPWLLFQAHADIESLIGFDTVNVIINDIAAKSSKTFPLAKANFLNKWAPTKVDLSAYAGKAITVTFEFDSGDCQNNTGAGVFIDNVMVRAAP